MNKTKEDLKVLITSNHKINKEMSFVCCFIIDYIFTNPSNVESKLRFDFLFNLSTYITDENIFYESVFYLSRFPIKLLDQKFEALDIFKNEYVEISDKEQILDMMRFEKYYNPIDKREITLEEFSVEVLTYFTVSDKYRKLICPSIVVIED